MNHSIVAAVLCYLTLGCGSVNQVGDNDGGTTDANADAPVDAPPDADNCPGFIAPPQSQSLQDRLCATALGFDGGTTMNLPCPDPSGNPNPGTHGVILQPATAMQSDDCPATAPMSRLISAKPLVGTASALVQLSTEDLTLNANDLFRVRVSCPAGVADCMGQLQITATDASGNNMPFFPNAGFEIVTPTNIVDVEVPIPAILAGAGARFNFICRTEGNGTADLIFQNPHIAPAP